MARSIAVLIAVLGLCGLQQAAAHISASPDMFNGGAYGTTALEVTHGCEGLSTTKLVLDVPGASWELGWGCAPRQRRSRVSPYRATANAEPQLLLVCRSECKHNDKSDCSHLTHFSYNRSLVSGRVRPSACRSAGCTTG